MEQNNKNTPSKKNPKKGGLPNKPKFNIYWVYGGLFILFLAMNFINIGGNVKVECRFLALE